MNEEFEIEKMNESTLEFKTNANRSERRKRLKFYVQQYKEHMHKLNDVSTVIPTDNNKDEVKALNEFVKRHILHSKILKDYIYAFIPKNWNGECLIFDNKTIYYNGKEL